MAHTLTITRPGGETLARHNLQNGGVVRIAAQDNVYYQLAAADGSAPYDVQTSRMGNDLQVQIPGGETLVIENYFVFDESGIKNFETVLLACEATARD